MSKSIETNEDSTDKIRDSRGVSSSFSEVIESMNSGKTRDYSNTLKTHNKLNGKSQNVFDLLR